VLFRSYVQHLAAAHQKKIDSVKTDKAKAQKSALAQADLEHVQTNRQGFNRVLQMHRHLQKAKNVLTNTLSSNSEFEHSINGKKAKPEGFVAVRHNRPTKFVDRREFSAANFNRDKVL
jgi:transposase-like protein